MILPHRRSRGAQRFRTRCASADVGIVGASMNMVGSDGSSAFVKLASRKGACHIVLVCVGVLLASSCGGGGGGGGSSTGSGGGSVSFSTNSISFKASAPFAQAPATQTITGTVTGVTSGTVYVAVQVNNPNNLFTVTNLTFGGKTAQADVIPAMPSVGVGSHSGSITIATCLNDPTCNTGQLAGSPRTISVTYDVASGVDGNTVTPSVVAANTTGTVILRGTGFSAATNVSFGASPAPSVSVVNDSEIDVSYPALTAGTYPITINSGGISFTASLVAVSPPAFTAAAIPYPAGVDVIAPAVAGIEYDPRRTALFILVPGVNSVNSTLLRYAFDGNTNTWGTPTQIAMAGLEQVHLSPDGTHLLGMVSPDSAHTSMVELDPVTLAQARVTTASNPANAATLCGFAIANDGNAIVGLGSLASAGGFAFGTSSRAFTPMPNTGICDPVAGGNGAIVAGGHENYVASGETFTQQGPDADTSTTADFAGDKFVGETGVEDQTGQFLGFANGFGEIINSTGTRSYALSLDPTTFAPVLLTFDLTAAPIVNPQPVFPQLGAPIALSNPCSPNNCAQGFYVFASTPDGSAVFIAGPGGVIVQPLP